MPPKIVVERSHNTVLGDLTNEQLAAQRKKRGRSLKAVIQKGSITEFNPEPWEKDPFKNLPILPGPRKHRRPNQERFLAGKSSIYSIAYAIDEKHQAEKVHNMRVKATTHWSYSDRLEYLKLQNKLYKERPAVPKAVRLKLKMNRLGVAYLIKMGYVGFFYETLPECIVFLKPQGSGKPEHDGSDEEDSSDEHAEQNTAKASGQGMALYEEVLRSSVRTHFVCFYHTGTLYAFNAETVDPFEMFELIVRAKHPKLKRGPKPQKHKRIPKVRKREYVVPETMRPAKEPSKFNREQTYLKLKKGPAPSFYNSSYLDGSLVPRKIKPKLSLEDARRRQRDLLCEKRNGVVSDFANGDLCKTEPPEQNDKAAGFDEHCEWLNSAGSEVTLSQFRKRRKSFKKNHIRKALVRPKSALLPWHAAYVDADSLPSPLRPQSAHMAISNTEGATNSIVSSPSLGQQGPTKILRPQSAHLSTPTRNQSQHHVRFQESPDPRVGERPQTAHPASRVPRHGGVPTQQQTQHERSDLRPTSAALSYTSYYSDISNEEPSIFRPNSAVSTGVLSDKTFSSSRPSSADQTSSRPHSAASSADEGFGRPSSSRPSSAVRPLSAASTSSLELRSHLGSALASQGSSRPASAASACFSDDTGDTIDHLEWKKKTKPVRLTVYDTSGWAKAVAEEQAHLEKQRELEDKKIKEAQKERRKWKHALFEESKKTGFAARLRGLIKKKKTFLFRK